MQHIIISVVLVKSELSTMDKMWLSKAGETS